MNFSHQRRNTSSTYSSSLKELLQRKISTLEEQLHRHAAALSSPDRHAAALSLDRHHSGPSRGDKGGKTGYNEDGRNNKVRAGGGKNADSYGDEDDQDTDGDHDEDDSDESDDEDDDGNDEDGDDSDDDDSDDNDGNDDDDEGEDDDDDDEEEREDVDDEDEEDEDRSNNEAERHSYLPHTYRTGFHSNKLETVLHQLHRKGTTFITTLTKIKNK